MPVVQAVLQNNIEEDPLDNDEQLQEQLDSLPYLCRFQVGNPPHGARYTGYFAHP